MMQLITVFSAATAIMPGVLGKEVAKNEKLGAELYDTGAMMNRIMMTKQVSLQVYERRVGYLL
jgi:hypothetical protein